MDGERPVGMARIVSDGGYTYFITDVIVHPDYQGYHIGTELISRVLDYIQKDVMDGETVMVSLMAAYKRDSFYHRFGFPSRPFGNTDQECPCGFRATFLVRSLPPDALLYKLIPGRIILIINSGKCFAQGFLLNTQGLAHFLQRGIEVPKLGVDVTE